jgi:hypothetical protein
MPQLMSFFDQHSHPLDTIKVRMQLSKSRKARGVSYDPTRLPAIPIYLDLPEELRWLTDVLKTCLFP